MAVKEESSHISITQRAGVGGKSVDGIWWSSFWSRGL